jgi:SWI/SNF-related matrix-associated actin-dependent regulator 1 of chromatin subfamily A
MVRRLKKDVLKDIPPKTRSIITFESSAKEKAEELQIRDELRRETENLIAYIELAKSNDDLAQFNKYTQELEQKQRIFFETISQQRATLGLQKIPHIIEHAEKVLKSGEKIIIFAHHREVVQKLHQHFGKRSVMLIGGAAADEVTDIVDEFQTNPDVKVFIGSILASATGLTLTAASTVIFGEFDWRPTTIIQAEDRAHRIGQTKNVEIHYLAAKDSIDEIMIRSFINKAEVNDKILDKKETAGEDIVFVDHPVDVGGEYVTKNITPEQIRKEAEDPTITNEVKEACLVLLQRIAGMDEDFARERNDVGFNKIDGIIGHSLANQRSLSNKQAVIARKLCNKYRRQLSGLPELKIVLDSLNSSKAVKKESFSRKSTFDILCEEVFINSFRLKS